MVIYLTKVLLLRFFLAVSPYRAGFQHIMRKIFWFSLYCSNHPDLSVIAFQRLTMKETCCIFALSMNLFMSHFSIYSLAVKLKMTHLSEQSALIFCFSSEHSKLPRAFNLSSFNITACPLYAQLELPHVLYLSSLFTRRNYLCLSLSQNARRNER